MICELRLLSWRDIWVFYKNMPQMGNYLPATQWKLILLWQDKLIG